MKWEEYVAASEKILNAPQVPSSLDIITLIKRVNPTSLTLCESDRAQGYQLKNKLQSLLLEHYGDAFYLVPHPASPNIILIKHRVLPSIDACHADLAALSVTAIERVEMAELPRQGGEEPKRSPAKRPSGTQAALSPKVAFKKARALLDEYDYAAAEEVLAGIHAEGSGDIDVLSRAAGVLLHEIGAYQRCIDILLRQSKKVVRDRTIRELLAVAYHHNGSVAEARAIFDELHPAEFGPEALLAYAEIAFRDGDLPAAWELLQMAQGKEGFLSGLETLQHEIEAAMSAQAEPVVQQALAELERGCIEEARQSAREALDRYPNCRQARAVIAAIETRHEEAQLAELWGRLETESDGERRIALLTTLLERDQESRDSIRKLMAEEKERQRRRLFDEQLESLRSLVQQERWRECFDGVSFLIRQEAFGERAGEVLSLSPFFRVLHENKRLQTISGRHAKELWLSFVKVKTALSAGHGAGGLETLEELKPWFGSSPEFKEDYLVLLHHEQEKARKEIALLIEQSEAPECPAGEVRLIQGSVRKRMPVLPIDERRELARSMEERLARLIPEQEPGRTLEEYREALQIGNSERAGYLRQEISDTAAVEALDAEFAKAFHIALEPLTLEFSDDLPIDLTTRPPLRLTYVEDDRVLLEDGRETFVMLDLAAKAACRFTSPLFAESTPIDSTQDGTFLFVEETSDDQFGDRVWRAELSLKRAAFTAHFNMREWFEVEAGFSLEAVMVSSEKDTDYYVLIKDDQGRCPGRVFRKRLAPKSTIQSLQLGKRTHLQLLRWSSCPDSFMVGGDKEMRHVNRNLSLRQRLGETPNIYKLDGRNGFIYGVENCWLTKRDRDLRLIKSWDKAYSFGMWEPERVHGISFPTDTALIVLGDGRQSFYNLGNNKFSNKIRVGRVIPSQHDGKWYCFDYSRKLAKLWLRDITRDIHSNLEWREFFSPQMKRKKMEKLLMWFNEHDNFVYRPWEWEASEAATLFSPNCCGFPGLGGR